MANPANATTSSDGKRYYEWNGEMLPSVTTLRRIVGVPFPLVNWMQANVMNAVIADPSLAVPQSGDKPVDTRRRIRQAADAERDAAADRGTAIHEAAEKGLLPESLDDTVGLPLVQFYNWVNESGAKVLSQEGQVFNTRLKYAGSYDLIIQLPDGRIIVCDIKTGKNIYADHAMQLMGYAMPDNIVGFGNQVDDANTQLLRSAHGVAVIHLTDTGWEFIELTVGKELRQAFESMCVLAHWLEVYDKSIEPLIASKTESK